MIEPTVGRVVWYYEDKSQTQPNAALLAFINSDGSINIGGLNSAGYHFARQNVKLLQTDADFDGKYPYATWMSWNREQVAKADKPISANSITYETTNTQAPTTHTFKD